MRDESVHVAAPARLHLGFLDPSGRGDRRFGGVGLAIDEPATRLTIERAEADTLEGLEAGRAAEHLITIRDYLGLEGHRYRITIDEAIPPHCGLGSGTQLALSLAAGIRVVEGRALDFEGDAARLGRGSRSGLGAAFLSGGGLAVDGGKGSGDAPPPIVAQLDFPAEWRVILVLDERTEGFHGADEIAAFHALPAFPESSTEAICRLVLMQALPAVAERNIAAFGAAIAQIQEMVGGHFAPAQGGLFTNRRVGNACHALAAAGAHGIGQSSWGPTGFAFASSASEAHRLVARIDAETRAEGLALRVVAGRNHGASIERSTQTRRRAGAI